MPAKPTLHVCSIDTGGPKIHPCRRAHEALESAGVDHETTVSAKNKPFGLFTSGKRPDLKKLSGQEKLPVLELTDGTTINGSSKIVAWAKANAVAA
ncbi:MAG TPA: glutathione S-transferase N-terminal domain-containing protein [Solirubrobacteraceae bacterium]|jgi:glutathione S-transferase|nr:glutathione S-transferase N-terminal domain-containing protein [Solirubrobacteraceae bacterium]